jgi:two-component system sensor histidine kinase KdpD
LTSDRPQRGALRIYLGAAPGVGKTYAMLNEGRRGRERGKDVVVGVVETHGRVNTEAQLGDLEVVARQVLDYRGTQLWEMDVDAVLARRPQLALVDELAHTNAPGCRHEKRWQDIDELLAAGIDVISTLNVQHLESLNDVVEEITGTVQRETVPDEWVRRADQIELIDMSSEALRRRMAHGNIYPAERVDAALGNYFRIGNLTALRELALLWVADRVDESLAGYRERHGIAATWETRERVVVALTGAPGGDDVIRRAARLASRGKADLVGVHVDVGDATAARNETSLSAHRELLQQVGGRYVEVVGDDVPRSLVEAARAEQATQLVVGASRRSRIAELSRGSVINRVMRLAGDIDVLVVGGNESASGGSLTVPLRGTAKLPRRRRAAGWLAAVVGPLLVTYVLTFSAHSADLSTVLLLFALLVVSIAATGGVGPAVVGAAASALSVNWFFVPPVHTLTIQDGENVVALVVFVLVGLIVSWFVTTAARRSIEATRARSEAETLVRMAAASVAEDPLRALVEHVRLAFHLDAAAVLERSDDTWSVAASAGGEAVATPEAADELLTIDNDVVLALTGEHIHSEDRLVLAAFSAQLAAAVRGRRLASDAAAASELVAVNELRAGLLAAVSHDLHTPLASIKASVSSLLASDVTWTPAATHEFLTAIDEETDRLDALVGNLLDMSRINAGALDVANIAVGVEEVVPAALASLGDRARHGAVELAVPETLPRVATDPALLERALANLIDNALAWSPPHRPVRVEAGVAAGHVHVRVVDRGPGIALADRERVFRPFQRVGDNSNGAGVGLGLAVARGFIGAVGAELLIDDTPGGGTTMVVVLPISVTT